MKLNLSNVSWEGPRIASAESLSGLPEEYSELLVMINGFIQFAGGLHVRGVCVEPGWHSLHAVWTGPFALHSLFPALTEEDVPFGEDALGDQYLLREERVIRLAGETGEVSALGLSFYEFLSAAQDDPIETLSLQPLAQFYAEGGRLEPGQLLHVTPPFRFPESQNGVRLQAVPAFERIRFLAELARRACQ